MYRFSSETRMLWVHFPMFIWMLFECINSPGNSDGKFYFYFYRCGPMLHFQHALSLINFCFYWWKIGTLWSFLQLISENRHSIVCFYMTAEFIAADRSIDFSLAAVSAPTRIGIELTVLTLLINIFSWWFLKDERTGISNTKRILC